MTSALQSKPLSDDYLAISVSMLMPSKLCGISLYMRENAEAPMRLFRGAEFPLTQKVLDDLVASGRRKLYVSSSEHRLFQQYLRDNLDEALANESQSVTQRFGTLNEVVRDILGEAFRKGDVDNLVHKSHELGEKTVHLICRDNVLASELCGVLYHDFHTFTHSANVAFYCVMLAKELGIAASDELNQIAAGGLMHDLGKLKIPEGLLTKPGKLTNAEYEVIKTHPTHGFSSLCERTDLSYGQLMMVYQHHERLDGGGYPVQSVGSEIHPWARICAVSDVFEALTSNRPYRSGMSFEEAFRIMDRSAGSGFDPEIYQCWKNLLEKGG